MTADIFFDEKAVLEAVKYMPSVSIILPFEPKMTAKKDLESRLQAAADKVEKDLTNTYPPEQYKPVTDRLKVLVKNVDFNTYKQSIALFVSPLTEKIYYLDIPVEEKIIIDESFEIRDLVYSKKDIHKYLILVLSNNKSQVFLGNTTQFVRIMSNRPEHLAGYRNDPPERVGNFSDPHARKEMQMDKFLHYIDNSLGILLKAYALPLFVMGADRTVGHFRKISRHTDRITDCIHGNFEEASEAEIRKLIAPYVSDWKKVKQQDLLKRLDMAMGAKKLVTGVRKVWKAANDKKGRLLVVEKNYMVPAQKGVNGELKDPDTETNKNPFFIKDAVDDIIEIVLANGGDVEFADEGELNKYQRIALINYY